MKIKEILKEFDVFPTSLHIYQRSKAIWSSDPNNHQSYKKTVKMITYEEFKEDPNQIATHLVKVFKDCFDEGLLPFPAQMLGATA